MKSTFLAVVPLLLVALLLTAGFGRAQEQESDIQLRLAQSYERGGDMETATRIYEQLYKKDPSNYIYFDALRRSYMQLKKYPETIALINQRLEAQPQDINLLSQMGRVYSFLSDEVKADQAWDRALAVAPQSETSYRVVAGAMMESRLYDKAIKMYLRGRQALGRPALFSSDLAFLYGAVLNYPEAVREYLNLMNEDPNQLAIVQSRIALFTGRPEGLAAAIQIVRERTDKEPANKVLPGLLSWLFMEGHQYDAAYEVERKIDSQSKAGGLQIYAFAERALRDHAIHAAALAFRDVITNYPSTSVIQQAKFGYARTLEDSSADQDTLRLFKQGGIPSRPASESEPAFHGAIAAYQSIVKEYPGTEIAARSLLQIGRLMFDRFFNLDEARSALETIQQNYAGYVPVLMDAQLLLGEVLLTEGAPGKAESSYNALLSMRTISHEMQQKAQFKLAEIEYFRGNFNDAVNALQGLTKNAAENITNDALDLLLFIQENVRADSTALIAFAKADLLQRQRKLSEALAADEQIRSRYAQTPLIDETLMNIGDILTTMGRYTEAIASYDSLIAGFPESIVLDRAMMKIGRIYQAGLKDPAKATAEYQQLLVKYPNSIYASEARKTIRTLRGDSL